MFNFRQAGKTAKGRIERQHGFHDGVDVISAHFARATRAERQLARPLLDQLPGLRSRLDQPPLQRTPAFRRRRSPAWFRSRFRGLPGLPGTASSGARGDDFQSDRKARPLGGQRAGNPYAQPLRRRGHGKHAPDAVADRARGVRHGRALVADLKRRVLSRRRRITRSLADTLHSSSGIQTGPSRRIAANPSSWPHYVLDMRSETSSSCSTSAVTSRRWKRLARSAESGVEIILFTDQWALRSPSLHRRFSAPGSRFPPHGTVPYAALPRGGADRGGTELELGTKPGTG